VALLTDQLSGTLRTDSSVGTTFTLTFPIRYRSCGQGQFGAKAQTANPEMSIRISAPLVN
jgi:hypothetical protein